MSIDPKKDGKTTSEPPEEPEEVKEMHRILQSYERNARVRLRKLRRDSATNFQAVAPEKKPEPV